MGILFLAGYLRDEGINVEVINFFNSKIQKNGDYYWQGENQAHIEIEFARRKPSIVGISSMFSIHCYAVHRVAAAAKRAIEHSPQISAEMARDISA